LAGAGSKRAAVRHRRLAGTAAHGNVSALTFRAVPARRAWNPDIERNRLEAWRAEAARSGTTVFCIDELRIEIR
jgi:hypothetical protein